MYPPGVMVIVPDAPLIDWERLSQFVAASTSWTFAPDATPDVPSVFPRFDAPAVCDTFGAEMTRLPPDMPAETAPIALIEIVRASIVVDDDAEVVFDKAYRPM